jgi:hypothetical protein
MSRERNPVQMFKEAVAIAQEHGLFIVEKNGEFRLFRRMEPKPVFIGKRGTTDGLRRLVCNVTNFR